MKVVTAHTMQHLDRRAINDYGIAGQELMENAGQACAERIVRDFGLPGANYAVIVAGKGNNGGDGYVIARQLVQKGWQVQVIVLAERSEISGDALTMLELLPATLVSFCPKQGELTAHHATDLQRATVLVDALLGTGLNTDLQGVYREAVALINGAPAPVVAVDIPSGVHGTSGAILGQAVQADLTVSFACAKLGQLLYPGALQTGRLEVVDIGIPPHLLAEAPGYDYLDEPSVAPLLAPRDRQAHKGSFGHCLVIAGSTGKSGAAALAANAAVRTGAGLVTLACPASINPVLELKTTEAMTAPVPDNASGQLSDAALPLLEQLLASKDAVALGPGIDRQPQTISLVHRLVETITQPLVIDADGLNAVAEDIGLLQRKASPCLVLTPHPGEMARLLGTALPTAPEARIEVARQFAASHGVYLILKGARTIIAAPDGRLAINGSGNPGMASGGMGDVLTGVLTALLGQGFPPWQACRLGVFVHGLAGDRVATDKGEIGMHAGDVVEALPYAFKQLMHRTSRQQTPDPSSQK